MSANTFSEEATQTVSPRQWIRLVVVYLLIPSILLICGGDLGWWQAWLYSLQIFAAGIGGRMWAEQRHPGLLAKRQNIKNIQNAKAWDKVFAPLMAVSIGFPMVIVAGLDHRYNWSPEFPLWLIVIGFILISLGYAFAAWALIESRFFSSVVRIQMDRGHVVCDSGPYRIVRHPGYAGNVLALPGMVLALSSMWTLIPAAVALMYAEEYIHGKLHKLKFLIKEVVPNRKIEFVPVSRLLRIYFPRNIFLIETRDGSCVFTASCVLRVGTLGQAASEKQA